MNYRLFLNIQQLTKALSLGILRYDVNYSKKLIEEKSKQSFLERSNTTSNNYITYNLNFNGIDYEFLYIESFLTQCFSLIVSGLKSSSEEVKSNTQQLVDDLKEFLSGKTITFDYNQIYKPKFDEFEEMFGKVTYFKKDFISTNSSKRVLTLIKF